MGVKPLLKRKLSGRRAGGARGAAPFEGSHRTGMRISSLPLRWRACRRTGASSVRCWKASP